MQKVYILSNKIKSRTNITDGILLSEQDFSPLQSFFALHLEISPESIDYIYQEGIFEDTKYLRCIIKHIEWMLKKDGVFELKIYSSKLKGYRCGIRAKDDIRYEMSIAFKDRMLLVEQQKDNNILTLKYKKSKNSLSENDSIDNWSFGIVSNGSKNERIMQIINRIKSFNIPHYEIIICGPSPYEHLPENVRIVDDSTFYSDIRIPICKKKNAIIKAATYENLMITHDRIMPKENWFISMQQYGNYFDAIVPSIIDEETKSMHIIDTPYYIDYNVYYPPLFKPTWTNHLYMDGGIMIIKKAVANRVLLSEFLHWGEAEDVDFGKRLYYDGAYTSINHSVVVYTLTYGHPGSKEKNLLQRMVVSLFSYPNWMLKKYIDRYSFKKYLKNRKL